MERLPNLNGLRAFEAAGRHLTFRAAAEELGVTQGAVAQQVRQLEAGLGVALFERLPKGLMLSEAGRAYHGGSPGVRRDAAGHGGAASDARAGDDQRHTELCGEMAHPQYGGSGRAASRCRSAHYGH